MKELEKEIYYKWYFRPPITDYLKKYYIRRCEIIWHTEIKQKKRLTTKCFDIPQWRLKRLTLDLKLAEVASSYENNNAMGIS